MKKQKKISYNLVDKPWIPVKDLQGNLIEVSLKDALLNAGSFLGIEDASPLVVISLYRFLLAVLHRALEGPSDISVAVEWYRKGFPNEKIEAYLSKWYDRFDLFHDEYPFYQTIGLPDDNSKYSTWRKMGAHISSGNNKLLFDHSYDLNEELCKPNEIVRLLLAVQTFGLGGGVSAYNLKNFMHAPSATAAFAFPVDDLFQKTLCLSLIPYSSEQYKIDSPFWEKNSFTYKMLLKKQIKTCLGITELYCWISRAIMIIPVVNDENTDISIRYIKFASGLSIDETGIKLEDPMVIYKKNNNGEIYKVTIKNERSFWRDYSSILPEYSTSQYKFTPVVIITAFNVIKRLKEQPIVSIAISGLSNNRAKIEKWVYESYRLPKGILEDCEIHGFIDELLRQSDNTARILKKSTVEYAINILSDDESNVDLNSLKSLVWSLLEEGSETKDEEKKINKNNHLFLLKERISNNPTYWSHMEQSFHHLLSMLNTDYTEEKIFTFWKAEQVKALQKAWNAVGTAAGSNARALKALSKSTGIIAQRINELKRNIK